jgi:molybdenum cofactor biosynthesis enzyme MoaA
MADLSSEGLAQINDSLDGLNDSIESSSSSLVDALKEGLNEIKEEILKVAVESLPVEFTNLAKQVEELTTYSKTISRITEEMQEDAKEKDGDEKVTNKTGPANGWTIAKLASKLPEREAAPALTIINSVEQLFGTKGSFLISLRDMLTTLLKDGGSKG